MYLAKAKGVKVSEHSGGLQPLNLYYLTFTSIQE